MLNLHEELRLAFAEALESPKVYAAVTSATTSVGIASYIDVLQGTMAVVATCVGVGCSILLGRVHWMKHKNEMLRYRLLKEKAQSLGIDDMEDDDES